MKSWCVFALCLACSSRAADEKRPVRVYTNEDLERVSSRRGETGVDSTPALPVSQGRNREETLRAAGPRQGESFWRREADQLRRRLFPLRERAAELEGRIEARRRQPGVRPYTDLQIRAWEARLEGLRRRIAEEEARVQERARRAGALPEWLR